MGGGNYGGGGGYNGGGSGGGGGSSQFDQDVDNPQVVAYTQGDIGDATAEANEQDAFATVNNQNGNADARVNGIGGSAEADVFGDQMMASSMGGNGMENAQVQVSPDGQTAMANTYMSTGGGGMGGGMNQGMGGMNQGGMN